jgi:sec-independent protein translocase protein TatB
MTPRAALTKHLFDGDDSLFTTFDQPVRGVPEPPAMQPITSHTTQQPVTGPAPFDTDAT